jgi:hypothetical protein
MRGCAWLTGIDRHALHVPCVSRLGLLAKPYLRWSLQGPGAFTLIILVKVFVLPHWSRNLCLFPKIMPFAELAHVGAEGTQAALCRDCLAADFRSSRGFSGGVS